MNNNKTCDIKMHNHFSSSLIDNYDCPGTNWFIIGNIL